MTGERYDELGSLAPPEAASAAATEFPPADRDTHAESAEDAPVTDRAKEAASKVTGDAADQAKAVAGEARQQVRNVVSQAGDELRHQAQAQNSRAASGLQTLSGQLSALAEGRTEESGPLAGYLDEAQTKVREIAQRLESGGPEGVVDDVTRFARRRPGLFLLGAIGVGFAVGRLVRSGASDANDADDTAGRTATGNGDRYDAPSPMTTAVGGDPFETRP